MKHLLHQELDFTTAGRDMYPSTCSIMSTVNAMIAIIRTGTT
jgi:hypothetical protein